MIHGAISGKYCMPARRKPASAKRTKAKAAAPIPRGPDAAAVISELRRRSSKRVREGMSRYGIPSDKAFGVSVGDMRRLAKRLGRSHALAESLWKTGWYEARMLATFVAEPERVTSAQMDRWCKDFDSWAICDTACFHLFDRSPHAWGRIAAWSRRKPEFEKRAAFALLACLALHDKSAETERFAGALPMIEKASLDERNFVKKSVSWALRAIGRRNGELHAAAVAASMRLAGSDNAAARWIGRDSLRELTGAVVERQMASKRQSGVKRR